jgi:hypothetical protein
LDFAQQDLEIKKQALSLAKRIEEKNQIKFFEVLRPVLILIKHKLNCTILKNNTWKH